MKIIDYPALTPYAERYAEMETGMVPFRVSLYTRANAPVAGYDPLHLDGLLARCVVEEATAGRLLPDEPVDAYRLPVPLRRLWESPPGFPLFAATSFRPAEEIPDTVYLHKRAQTGRWTKTKSGRFAVITIKGPDMERRVPVRANVCGEWVAEGIGNPEEVARLLGRLTAIGKHRARGFGELDSPNIGQVEPLEDFAVVAAGRLLRPVPLAAAPDLLGVFPTDAPSPVCWTLPYWKMSLALPGWREGAAVPCSAEEC